MKQTINESQFLTIFRQLRPDNFSYEGLLALFEHLEAYEESCGEELELDVIGICGEFSEYKSALEAAQAQGYEEAVDLEKHGSVDLPEVDELQEKQAREWLEERTTVIDVEDGGVIIQNF